MLVVLYWKIIHILFDNLFHSAVSYFIFICFISSIMMKTHLKLCKMSMLQSTMKVYTAIVPYYNYM